MNGYRHGVGPYGRLEGFSSNRWVLPVGASVGKIFKICGQPINTNLHVYYNVERPEDAPDWSIRFAVQFIFPKK